MIAMCERRIAVFDFGYNPRADYNMDGEVEPFEEALFLLEMEEEDDEIEAQYHHAETSEDYIGLDLESCTLLDPDYVGDESLGELVDRYGIDLSEEDRRFYRESQGDYGDDDLSDDDDDFDIFDSEDDDDF